MPDPIAHELLVDPPHRPVWYLRPFLWVAKRAAGKDPLPGRLLAHFPKGALGAGVFEACAAHGPKDLDTRLLAIARIVAAAIAGCPFCIDMNAASWKRAGLTPEELHVLLACDPGAWRAWPERDHLVADYARALSLTPIEVPSELRRGLRGAFLPRELIVLATTIAQVNYWARFNQGLGVPSSGLFDDSACAIE